MYQNNTLMFTTTKSMKKAGHHNQFICKDLWRPCPALSGTGAGQFAPRKRRFVAVTHFLERLCVGKNLFFRGFVRHRYRTRKCQMGGKTAPENGGQCNLASLQSADALPVPGNSP